MPFLFPGLVIGEPLVRQAGEAKPGVADPDALAFVGHDLGSNVHQGTLPLRNHLPSTFPTMDEHQLMQSDGRVAAVHLPS